MKLPDELTLTINEMEVRVRYEYDRGEDQWFDARAGVGSPGYPAAAWMTEINFGKGWEDPDIYPQLNRDAIDEEIMDRLADLEAAENAARDEAEYQHWQENKSLALDESQ